MTPEQIKNEIDNHFKSINESHERIRHLRSICDHPDSSINLYSWRHGAIEEVLMCDYCKEIINEERNI